MGNPVSVRNTVDQFDNVVIKNRLIRSTGVLAIATLLGIITNFGLKEAQRLSKWNVAPFKGEVPANLTFGTLLIAYTSFGLWATRVHPLKNLHRFFTGLLNHENRVRDDTIVAKNLVQYKTKLVIIKQLNDPRYNFITVDGEPLIQDGTVGTQLFTLLTEEPQELSEERAVRVINQLEIQVFSDPTEDLQNICRLILPWSSVAANPELPELTLDLDVQGESFDIKAKTSLQVIHNGEVLATIALEVNISIPKDAAAQETASYSWTITDVPDFIN